MTLDGRTAAIDAPAWRDHSWGVRHWDSFVSSRSFGGSFGDALQFRYGSMVGTNGSFFRKGSLLRGGTELDVTATEMLVHLDDDSLRCPSAEVRYRMADGATTIVRIDTIGGMIGSTRRRYGWESVGDVSVDGEPGGWGFLEVNNNPRNGNDPPAFALADALSNGITRASRERRSSEERVRQPPDDRALYYRQLRDTVHAQILPELTSAQAIDAAALVDRILAEFIVEEEFASALSAEFGAAFAACLEPSLEVGDDVAVTPEQFHELRKRAAETVARTAGSSDASEHDVALALVAIEGRFLERVDELRTAVLTEDLDHDHAPSATACSVTAEQLTSYLRHRYPSSPDLIVDRVSVVPGGRSKETILVAFERHRRAPA